MMATNVYEMTKRAQAGDTIVPRKKLVLRDVLGSGEHGRIKTAWLYVPTVEGYLNECCDHPERVHVKVHVDLINRVEINGRMRRTSTYVWCCPVNPADRPLPVVCHRALDRDEDTFQRDLRQLFAKGVVPVCRWDVVNMTMPYALRSL